MINCTIVRMIHCRCWKFKMFNFLWQKKKFNLWKHNHCCTW